MYLENKIELQDENAKSQEGNGEGEGMTRMYNSGPV
jgi:hypothetical protein